MKRILIAVDLPDCERTPAIGEAFAVENVNYLSGLIGVVVNDTLLDIHAGLFPEKYPPGHPLHDPTHMYWDGVEKRYSEADLRAMSDEDLVEEFERWTDDEFLWGDDDGPLDSLRRSRMIQRVLVAQNEAEPEPYEWDSETIEWVASDIGNALSDHPQANV